MSDGTPLPDTEALRQAALRASWARDRQVGQRRLQWRWVQWGLQNIGLPLAVVGVGAALVVWAVLPEFVDRSATVTSAWVRQGSAPTTPSLSTSTPAAPATSAAGAASAAGASDGAAAATPAPMAPLASAVPVAQAPAADAAAANPAAASDARSSAPASAATTDSTAPPAAALDTPNLKIAADPAAAGATAVATRLGRPGAGTTSPASPASAPPPNPSLRLDLGPIGPTGRSAP